MSDRKLNKKMKELEEQFKSSVHAVADALDVCPTSLTRDKYIDYAIDHDMPRLNKEKLNSLGGFREAKSRLLTPKGENLTQPKVLIFDIETAPIMGYVWGLFQNDVSLNQIEADWYVLSWSAKWLTDSADKVMYMDQRNAKNIEDDSKILEKIRNLLDEADIVITQNGKRFDVKKLNARFLEHGMRPPSSFDHIDTLVIAKKHFAFTSNKLAYMTDRFCVKYKKLDHGKYPGFKMWTACMKGDLEAWKEMERYNKYDVLSLEELYHILIPWEGGIDFNLYHNELYNVCKCGNLKLEENGFKYTASGKFQRYTCGECGAETRSTVNLLSKEKRKSLKKKSR